MKTKKLQLFAATLAVGMFTFTNITKAQVGVDTVKFGNPGCGTLPASITAIPLLIDWFPGSTNPSSGYAGASGTCNLRAEAGNDIGTETMTYTVSTAAYANTQLKWGGRKDAGFPAVTLDYSLNGVSYTSITYTDVTANSTWALVPTITLPAACNNVATLYLRWSFVDDGLYPLPQYYFDDITVIGTINTYFDRTGQGASLQNTSAWTVNYNGTLGTAPANFTTAGITYEIKNNAAATIGAAWTVSGAGSFVRVGDATTVPAINFTIPAASAYTGPVSVMNTSTLTILNTTIPTFSTLATGSTVNYAAAGAQSVTPAVYFNLTISGSGTKTFLSTPNATVGGTLNLSAGDLALAGSPRNLQLQGPITGSGTLTGNTGATLFITGSGALGTLNFTAGSQTLGRLLITRTAPFTATLGTDLTISSVFASTGFQPSTGVLNLNGRTLIVNGISVLPAASGAGVIRGSAASVLTFSNTISSGNLYMDQTSPATRSLSALTVNTGTTTLTLGNTLNIIDSVVPVIGTIASGGFLTLVADQATVGHTGRIGVVGGSITGNIVSQVYHRPNTNNTDWRNLGSAGISNATFSSWNSQFPMTCPTCPNTQVGGVAFSSITTYQESNATYPDITYGGTITPGQGYWVYLGSSAPGTASAPYLISVTGTAQTGNVSAAVTSVCPTATLTGYNLVANPYASPISFPKLRANNSALLNNEWYTYSPAYGDNAAWVGGISTPAYSYGGMGIDATIPAGMGFFVRATGAGNVNFIENLKVTGSNEVLLKEGNPNSSQAAYTFFRMQVNGNSMMNEAVVRFDANATAGYDPGYDFYDFAPGTPGWLQISSSSLGKNYTVNSLPDLTQNYSIPVKITCGTTGVYQFAASDLQNIPSGVCLVLRDNYTGVNHDLRLGSFSLTVTDTEKVARFKLNVTVAPLAITSNATQATCSNKNNAFLTAVGTNAGPWNYTWKNANNTVVKTSLNKVGADSLTGLNSGVYKVDVNTVGSCDNATQTFTLTAPAAPASVFSPSATQVNVGTNITFTNNSTNANTYWWKFGDGNTSNLQSPVYAYSLAGVYTVTLYAINSLCGDTVSSIQSITVGATGIASVSTNEEVILSKDQNGAYVKFNYSGQTKVNINVYNSLGQVLLSNANLAVVNDKIYLNLDNAKDQMIFVGIVNLDKNTQTTKKLYNN